MMNQIKKRNLLSWLRNNTKKEEQIKKSLNDCALYKKEREEGDLTINKYLDPNEIKNKIIDESTQMERPLSNIDLHSDRKIGFSRLKFSLCKTRENLVASLSHLFLRKKIDNFLFEELEEKLLVADVGIHTTSRIMNHLIQQANHKQLRNADLLYNFLKDEMYNTLIKVNIPLKINNKIPFIILMVGVNGVGKTTTIGKLAHQYQTYGKSVMLAAGDTFRIAAIEQLQTWGQYNNIPVIAQHTGADAASVIFDAIKSATSRKIDVLIVDTAGRLHNKKYLMEELKKIIRVIKKIDINFPQEIMLVIDASTGQNAINQAKLFYESIGITGITLTKLDGSAKGGVIFSIADQFNIPIRYIGVGENIEDLQAFDASNFIDAIFT